MVSNMILLKGFLRKKSTMLYLFIFSGLLSVILMLCSFANYYSSLKSEIFSRNSFIIIKSKKDYYENLNTNKNIISFERLLCFSPDYSNENLLNSEEKSSNTTGLYWSDFFANDFANDDVILVSQNSQLNNNQIDLEIGFNVFKRIKDDDTSFFPKVGDLISLYYKNSKYEFIIRKISKSSSSKMSISKNLFEKLLENERYFTYKVIIKDFKSAELLIDEVEHSETSNDYIISLNQTNANDFQSTERFEKIINILYYLNYVVILLFVIIYIISINNIVEDETKMSDIEKILGYSRGKRLLSMLLKLSFIVFLSIGISIIISLLLCYIFNVIYDFKLTLNGILNIISWYLITTFVIILLKIFLTRKFVDKQLYC